MNVGTETINIFLIVKIRLVNMFILSLKEFLLRI